MFHYFLVRPVHTRIFEDSVYSWYRRSATTSTVGTRDSIGTEQALRRSAILNFEACLRGGTLVPIQKSHRVPGCLPILLLSLPFNVQDEAVVHGACFIVSLDETKYSGVCTVHSTLLHTAHSLIHLCHWLAYEF